MSISMGVYWSLVILALNAGWAVILFFRDRRAACAERSTALLNRALEIDRLLVEHPEIQQYLARTIDKDESYFRTQAVLQDDQFFKAKSLVYWHLNLFDELLSLATSSRLGSLINGPYVVELSDWESYIKCKLRHPLYRSVMNNESHIFGSAFRNFWETHKASISPVLDPFSW